jgi:hypothetical protein
MGARVLASAYTGIEVLLQMNAEFFYVEWILIKIILSKPTP